MPLPLPLARTAAACVVALPLLAQATRVNFGDCTEFVGVAPVDAAAARALLPASCIPVTDDAGARLVVRIADCRAVSVGSQPPRPGRIGQVGLMVVSPDGTATDPNTSINNHTLAYATSSLALAAALRIAGVPTRFLANGWFDSPRGTVKMATDIPAIAFDFASQVDFTAPRRGVLGTLLPSSRVAGFPLSLRGAFAAGAMAVTVKR